MEDQIKLLELRVSILEKKLHLQDLQKIIDASKKVLEEAPHDDTDAGDDSVPRPPEDIQEQLDA